MTPRLSDDQLSPSTSESSPPGWLARLAVLSSTILIAFAWMALAPAQQEDEKEEGEVAEAKAMPRNPGFNDETLEQWVFGQVGSTAKGARKKLESFLTLQAECIDRDCKLTETQKKKVNLSGRGDIKRFYDRYEKVKAKFQLVKHDQNKVNQIWQDINPLQQELMVGLFHEDSFLGKSMKNTLTAEQFARYDAITRERRAFRHRAGIELAVALLEQSMPLREGQRQKVIELLLKETKPPRRYGQYEFYVVMVQLARVPNEKLQPLFDNAQWKVVSRLMMQYKGMEHWLKQSGQMPEEGDEEDAKPAAPVLVPMAVN